MIDPSEFKEILLELQRKPLPNNYERSSGVGRSQCFGIVNRRSMPADYSRHCWGRPYLYKLLLEFAEKHVSIPFTSITVNQNYMALPHKDKNNVGDSFLVGFGSYTGGNLVVSGEGEYDIYCKPIVRDFSVVEHYVKEFTGERYSLVFYTCKGYVDVPPPSVRMVDEVWVFYRGEEAIIDGIPHVKKGVKKNKILNSEVSQG